jgi:hypothetical protein
MTAWVWPCCAKRRRPAVALTKPVASRRWRSNDGSPTRCEAFCRRPFRTVRTEGGAFSESQTSRRRCSRYRHRRRRERLVVLRLRPRPECGRRARDDPPHDIGDSVCRRDGRRRSGSRPGHSLDTTVPLSTARDHSGGRRATRCGAPDANQSARDSYRRVARRPSLARRTDDRFEPHHRIHFRPREEDRSTTRSKC